MNHYPWLDEHLLSMPGAVKDFKVEWQWFRYLVAGKMFAAVCCPGPEHKTVAGRELVTLKCEPSMAELLREEFSDVIPGFYMDKRNWISVFLDGAVAEDVLRDLCERSYRLVMEKLPKKVQKELLP